MRSDLKRRWERKLNQWRYRYMPRLTNRFADLATYKARHALRSSGPLTILLDNTILGHAITHETAWISTGTSLWGGVHPIDTGYQARVPVYPVNSTALVYEHIKYLTGISHLARQGHLSMKTSAELRDEQFRQPAGRYRGYGHFDYSLFAGVAMESVDGMVGPDIGPSWMNLPSAAVQQRSRLNRSQDPLYLDLVRLLGEKNSQDAWHIRTAEAHCMCCFLTMDFKLRKAVERLSRTQAFASLKTRVLTPAELGKTLGLLPFAPHIFSYTDASCPVRADLSMPEGKRRPFSAYRRSGAPLEKK